MKEPAAVGRNRPPSYSLSLSYSCFVDGQFVARPVGDIHIGCKMAEDNKDVAEVDTFEAVEAAGDVVTSGPEEEAVEVAEVEYGYSATCGVRHNLEILLIKDQQCQL